MTEVMRVLVWVGWSKYPRMRPEQSMTYLGGRVVALLRKGLDCSPHPFRAIKNIFGWKGGGLALQGP